MGRTVCKGHSRPMTRCFSMFHVSSTVAHSATQGAAPPCGESRVNWLSAKQGSANLLSVLPPTVGLHRLICGISFYWPIQTLERGFLWCTEGQDHRFDRGDADSQTQRCHPCACSWLLTLLVIVFFPIESQVYAEWSSGYSFPVVIIFPGDAGVQLMRRLRTSLRLLEVFTPCPGVCSFTGKPQYNFHIQIKSHCHSSPKTDRTCLC